MIILCARQISPPTTPRQVRRSDDCEPTGVERDILRLWGLDRGPANFADGAFWVRLKRALEVETGPVSVSSRLKAS